MPLVIWRIKEATTNAPVGGAIVTAAVFDQEGHETSRIFGITNGCGDFDCDIPAGSYLVLVSHLSYKTRMINAEIRECGRITIELDRI